MLIIFTSAASGEVISLEENGKAVLAALHKDARDAQGIVTVAQLPGAISRLRAAIDAEVVRLLCRKAEGGVDEDDSFFETGPKNPLDDAVLAPQHIDATTWQPLAQPPALIATSAQRRRPRAAAAIHAAGGIRLCAADLEVLCAAGCRGGGLSARRQNRQASFLSHAQARRTESAGR